jgi:hypothetical protein
MSKVLPKLVSSVDVFLLEAEHDGPKILVIGEIIPMLCPVKVFFMAFLFYRCQTEGAIFFPMFFEVRLFSLRFFYSETSSMY